MPRPRRSPRRRGTRFETLAENWLADKGLQRITTNFSSRQGEIDLVMRDGATVVFIEVRYRRSTGFGTAAETVTRSKQARVVAAARYFLHTHPEWQQSPCRFDVIAISGSETTPRIDWIENAFAA